MKPIVCTLLLAMILLLSSCRSTPSRLESALLFAGDNRHELESVLAHYQHDSLKGRAARFLIENMPAYYTYKGSVLDSLQVALSQYADSFKYDRSRFDILKNFPYERLTKEYDAKVIKAEFLIENIDHSFKVWNERPWGKYVSFDQFCEFLLPYRIKHEPLTHWKKELYHQFSPLLEAKYKGTDVIVACDSMITCLNDKNWVYFNDFNDPHVSAQFLVDKRIGNCEDQCDWMVYVMRSVGIPVATDSYLCSPELQYSHAWNVVLDTTGHVVSFAPNARNPVRGKGITRKKGKVYRYTYGIQKMPTKMRAGERIPAEMSDCFLRDVSADYFPSNKVIVDCDFIKDGKEHPIWLATFSQSGWKVIGEGQCRKGKGHFCDVESGLIYTALYSKGGKLTEAGYPFIIDKGTGNVNHYRPEGEDCRMEITRKYPLTVSIKTYMERMTNGRFEGANRVDFSDAEVLFQIRGAVRKVFHEALLVPNKQFRYVRYVSDAKYPRDIAEVGWYEKDGDGKKLTGKLFSSPAYRNHPDNLAVNAIDDDPLTYFSSEARSGWVALDLGMAKEIERISYVPRNDDNFVRIGDVYELFYQSEGGWRSLGRKKADRTELIYDNAPRYAVFWLRNLTRGKEEQVFSYYEGKQHFNYDMD